MKQKNLQFLLLFLMGCVLTSCEKVVVEVDGPQGTNTTSKPTNKNVVVRVTGIDTGWNGSASRSQVSIAEVCTRLQFAVFQGNTRVKYGNQQVGDGDFGTFALQLDAGTYQLLVLGHSGATNVATTNPAKLQFTNPSASNGTGFTDTFYYYGDMVVSDDGAQVSISMKRATSLFRLKTNDAMPSNAKEIQITYTGGSGALDATTGFGCVNSNQVVFMALDEELVGQPLEFNLYTFLRQETGKLAFTVKVFDANKTNIITKEFKDVPMKRNCITQYSGNFFTDGDSETPELPGEPETPDTPQPDVTVSGTIYVDPDWAEIFEYTYY